MIWIKTYIYTTEITSHVCLTTLSFFITFETFQDPSNMLENTQSIRSAVIIKVLISPKWFEVVSRQLSDNAIDSDFE